MVKQHFSHVRHWVFDLDNTLYSPAVRLFDQIERRMTDFVMRVTGHAEAEASALRLRYWQDHGTTLAGLMAHHEVDPDAYLVEVHDISFDALTPDPHLARLITALPGRKIVYTNGSAPYAARVLEARGLDLWRGGCGLPAQAAARGLCPDLRPRRHRCRHRRHVRG
jgi:putative hydrolase of the HAD superfamily